MTQFQIQLGNSFFKSLGAEDMEPLLAINEIIANSIDSWIEEYCGKKTKRPKLSIDIKMSAKEITIQDNAGGMEPEELKNAMGLAKVQKELSDCADDLMGMYGFGLKAATANLGGHFEVVSKRKNKELCHVVMPIEKMAEAVLEGKSGMLSDIEESGYNKKTKIKDVEKLFKPANTKSGTLVYISQIKRTNFNPESIMNELCYAWHFFTQENHLGPPVEIKFNGVKIGEPDWGKEQGGQIPYSSIDFEFPFSWREKTKTIDTKIQFSIWLNFKGGQYQAGGLSLYRKLQMVSYRDQEIGKWWSNESAVIEGYLSTSYLTPNQRKDDLDRTTRFYKEFNKAIEPLMKGASKLVSSSSGYSTLEMAKDDFERNKFLALKWHKYFNEHPLINVSSKFPKELEKFLKDEKDIPVGPDEPGPEEPGGPDEPGPEEPGGPENPVVEIFEPIDENSFNFHGETYQLLILKDKTDGSSYDWKKTGEQIEIFIDDEIDGINKEMEGMLKKMTDDPGTGKWEKLSLNLIKEHVIHQFLLNENIQNARAFAFAKSWIENIYKNE
tara:strand:+ start:486 stop:2144 length:1659 start_codon:yes stop_codon:yes gene_type:complete